MDVVPAMGANTLTPRQYQAKWMARYELERATSLTPTRPPQHPHHRHHAPDSQRPSRAGLAQPGSCLGGSTTPIGGDWALPGPRASLDANPAGINTPHHDYAAWDWIIPANTPIYAVRGGRVDRITNWPYNWWSQGCGESGRPGCASCGVGVTIVDDTGYRWTYCHGTSLTVTLGDTVTAGQQVLWSGNTGRSGTAHLHLEIRTDGHPALPPTTHPLPLPTTASDSTHSPCPTNWMQLLMDHTTQPQRSPRSPSDDLTDALIDRHTLDDHQWDRAITTLRIAREQHGGRIRHLIHVILDAGHHPRTRSAPRRPHRAALPPRRRRRPTAHATPTTPAQPSPTTRPAATHPTRAVRRPARRTDRRLASTTI